MVSQVVRSPSVSAPPTLSEVYSPGSSFKNITREHGFERLEIEGTLPQDLSGTLYRNGPAQFDLFGHKESHWFTGDGAVVACRFGNGQATGAHRFVQSAGRRAEQAAQKRLYGMNAPWWRRARSVLKGDVKNAANTNVMVWNDRLFALMEADKPVELDPDSLETVGSTDLDGVVAGMFSAHPHKVGETWFNFGMRYGPKSFIDLYRLGAKAERITSIEVPRPVMLHDFIATEKHAVFFMSPSTIITWRAVLQVGEFPDMFKWRPDLGTEIIVVPWDNPQQVTRFSVDAFYQWHFANAFEDRGDVVVDFVRYPDFSSFDQFDLRNADDPTAGASTDDGRYTRARVDVAQKKISFEERAEMPVEFPRVAPRIEGQRQAFTYLFGADGRTLFKYDEQSERAERHVIDGALFGSEPIFVPATNGANEDDGYILSLVYDAKHHRSGVRVIDARRFESNPLATCWYDHHVPMTFHGTFVLG